MWFILEVYSQEAPVRGVVGQGGEENPQTLGYRAVLLGTCPGLCPTHRNDLPRDKEV